MLRLVFVCALALVPGLALAAPAALVDPRSGGMTIGLGEWSVAPEAPAIRPGRVTFVVTNRGKVAHAFRIREESDRRGRDRFEARTEILRPGQTARLTVTLAPGVYSIECPIEGHDDLGMERRFTVDESAPLVRPRRAGGTTVRIETFAYAPQTLRTTVGTTVRWTNADPAQHTVTSTGNGPLSSTVLGRGKGYTFRFGRAGTFAYFCEIHPSMKGRVVVARP